MRSPDRSASPSVVAVCSVLVAGCSAAPVHHATAAHAPSAIAPAPVAVAPTPVHATAERVLSHEEALAFGTGATLTVPVGWSIATDGSVATLRGPEHDLTVSLLEREATSADAAIADAWHVVQPGFAREAIHRAAPPPRDGWDEIVQTVYRTAPSESRAVLAIALRHGTRYEVALIDCTTAALGRRGAQMQTAVQSIRTPGVAEESWAHRTPHGFDGERAAAFERFVRTAMTDERIPGAAVGVLQGGRLVFSQGFGVRAMGDPAAVTPRTLFMIGSNTKSLTTLMMARLVDQGHLAWDTPVVRYLPAFRLADADLAAHLDLEHTVCACTGMPRRDLEFLFEYAHATPEHWIDAMATMAPTTRVGDVFQYSNLLVAVGGFATARALHPTGDLRIATEHALRDEVFRPLGMNATTLEIREARAHEHAEPHARRLDDTMARIPLAMEGGVESVGPAGAAWSSVEDLSRYLAMELRRGALPDGGRYISEAALLERRRPRIRIDEHLRYGLGLVVSDAHDVAAITHGGNTLGFTSDMIAYPDLDLALVVLTNAGAANSFTAAVGRRLMELVLDAHEDAATRLAYRRTDETRTRAEIMSRVDAAPPAAWYGPWLGSWHNDSLGRVQLREHAGELSLDVGEWTSRVGRERAPGGEDALILLDPPVAGLSLEMPAGDAHDALVLDYPQQPYRFTREAIPTTRTH